MSLHNCRNCYLRKKYDKEPQSLIGRFWRWHAGWCPMWKSYLASLSEQERTDLINRYNLR